MFNIRRATLDDLPHLLNMGERFVNHYGHFSFDAPTVLAMLVNLVQHHYVIVAEEEGVLFGMIGAMVVPNIWNKHDILFQEMFWWVDEDHRDGSAGIRLLLAMHKLAPVGAKKVLSVLPNTNFKDKTLAKLGYKLTEMAYAKE
jgi:hypothetical protein